MSWLVGMAAVGKILRYHMILKKTPPCCARTFARERSHGLTGSGGSYAVMCISLGRLAMPCLEVSPSSPKRPQTIPHSKTDSADRFWIDVSTSNFRPKTCLNFQELCFSYVEPFLSFGQRSRIFEERIMACIFQLNIPEIPKSDVAFMLNVRL